MLEGKSSLRPDQHCTIAHAFVTADLEEQVGAKNANLAQLKNVLDLNVPDGFAVTSSAFHRFLSYNGLDREIESTTAQWKEKQITAKEASGIIRRRIDGATVPPGMKKEIHKALKKLAGWGSKRKLRLAVRSSAVGEDGKNSFAGQYTSCINTSADLFYNSYKTVASSAYSREAMAYRDANGFEEHEMAMAVACMEMVLPKVSGVLYTLDPAHPEKSRMKINATWGLGAPLVSGQAIFDNYDVAREAPTKLFT
ncbi:PEP/pyruvate-binding domain-containing protein [Desulfobacter vibrioformis]|uniref:PEP/pyruvate-binding domain-containing protein n=1 Tax=Desulfobacter vibrioformis TaxID=34031 RepID=UPI00069186B0|nr:PEP/pyruvate-binding domain-containing protein [Desulfobacter vibrioformis]